MNKAFTAKEIAGALRISKQAVMKRAAKESWSFVNGNGKGGNHRKYSISALPSDVQEAIVGQITESPIYKDTNSAPAASRLTDMLPALSPSAAQMVVNALVHDQFSISTFAESLETKSTWSADTAVHEQDLQDPRIRNILAILRDVDQIPRTWSEGKRKWIESVAIRHDVRWQSIYRWMKKYEKRGIAGLRHEKSSKGKPRVWTSEAVDFWIGLVGKREHRKMARKDLYECLAIEAQRRGWKIGDRASANWWFKKKWNPLMEAMQKGGLRALDNLLPPTLRGYSDMAPFEMLVGDQHRFDFWVMDAETGEVFRPEGYLWQDLRTRLIYGAAVDRRYDADMIGLALRVGIALFGTFGSIYTDNGKPECSKYLTGILANLRGLGMEWDRTQDVMMDVVDVDGEDIDPHYIIPGTHKKAIVKNAKAKMIERTNGVLEQIMASHLRLPGSTKRMRDDIHWQDVDHNEAMALAKAGKLPTFLEFVLALFLACDYYNRQKHHRGVHREWSGKPKPAVTTPMDCLRACYDEGWRPKMISPDAANMLFLARASRVVYQGRINFENDFYQHDALLSLHKQRVDIRYNPMIQDELHVFLAGRYLCTAVPVERSSMKDMDLAARKIAEKRERRKRFADEFRRVTSLAPDFRQYSAIPEAERVAALIGDDRKRRAEENKLLSAPVTQEEIDAHIAKMEQGVPLPAKTRKPLPARPTYFLDDFSRFEWLSEYLKAGGDLSAEDEAFKDRYLASVTPDQREYYETMLGTVNG